MCAPSCECTPAWFACLALRVGLQAELEQTLEQLQTAQQAAEEAQQARQAAEAAAAAQREQQEGDVDALVQHHAEEVAALREQLREQQDAAAAARQQAEAALVRLSEAEGGRSKAGGRIEQLAQAS